MAKKLKKRTNTQKKSNRKFDIFAITKWSGKRWLFVFCLLFAISGVITLAKNYAAGTDRTFITDIKCTSENFCVAVGGVTNGKPQQYLEFPVIEMWNGKSWALNYLPLPSNHIVGKILSVDCLSPSYCMAIGSARTNADYSTKSVSYIFDGNSWKLTALPNAITARYTFLNSVDCVDASYCIAVGRGPNLINNDTNNPPNEVTIAQLWNGSTWTTLNPQNQGTAINELNDVSCISRSYCHAIGHKKDTGFGSVPFAQQWDGSAWKISTFDAVEAQRIYPASISCVSSTECVTVGQRLENDSFKPMAATWNGSKWQLSNPIEPTYTGSGELSNHFFDVSCTASSKCMAVGKGYSRNLAEQFDGTKWGVLSPPRPNKAEHYWLYNTSCINDNWCLINGYYRTKGGEQIQVAYTYNNGNWSYAPYLNASIRDAQQSQY